MGAEWGPQSELSPGVPAWSLIPSLGCAFALSSLAKEGEICTGLTILGGIWAESALPSRATLHGTQSDLRLRLVLMATDWQASQQRHAGLVLSWGPREGTGSYS